MEGKQLNVKKLARMGQRGTFGVEMVEKAEKNKELIVMTADVAIPAGLDRFRKKYPEQFIDVGIAEQNMIGIAAGLSSEGLDVYTTTYAPFHTLRCLEQIRMDIAEMKLPVKMVGLSSGVVLGMIGNMHCSFEDIAILRALPNITIVSPADSYELVKVLNALDDYKHPVYLRLTGGAPSPIIYKEDYDFKLGQANVLREGTDVSIIGVGTILEQALRAAEILEDLGVSVEVINMHTIRPLDMDVIHRVFTNRKLVVTLEEHVTMGGLGGAIAEASGLIRNKAPQLLLGLPADYSTAGIYEEMLDVYGLSAKEIEHKIRLTLQSI